ncbi:MAG: MASE1 domain-containing protein [Betaproteobacteria bacterium]|nr:MASE1 domain-containing protein [Betaproteobacteria bacterium]
MSPSTDRDPAALLDSPAGERVRKLFWLLVFGAVYVLLFRFAVSLPYRAGIAACVWPADGLALAVLLRVPYREWPAYCVMILVANATGGWLSGFSLRVDGFVGMNAMQPALAAWLMRRYLRLPQALDTVKGMVSFILVATGVTLLMAFLGAFDEQLSAGEPFEVLFRALFIADLLGILCVAPLVLAFSREGRQRLRHTLTGRAAEAVILFVALVAITHELFGLAPDAKGWVPQVQYFTIPLLVWAALRFGLRGASLALTTYAAIAIWHTTAGFGPFIVGASGQRETVLALQLYVGLVGMMVLVGAALMTEFRDALADNESWRHRFAAAIEASGNIVFEMDTRDGRIVWGGDTRRVMGLDPREVADTALWTARIHPEDQAHLLDMRKRLSDGSLHAADLEYRVRRGDGQWMRASVRAYSVEAPASPLSLGRAQGRRIVGFVEDITEKRRAADERAHLEAELRQAQKMEAIGSLAGGIAHDFNNILASILGYGEMARRRAGDDAKLAGYLDTLLKAAERGRQLVAQILAFSRKSTGERTPVLASDLIDEVAALLRGSTPHEVVVNGPPAPDTRVLANATELHQLFMNLATNGLQSMVNGGRLAITIDCVRLDSSLTLVHGPLPSGDYLRVAFTDHGTGIDEQTQRRMFEPFFTTKAAGRGTGFGLPLALSIARAHGGGLEVESVPGAGSTFRVWLPRAGATEALPPVAPADLPRGQDERILILDDEPALLALAEEILVELGYQVAGYASSEAALEALLAAPERFDAVLSDEVMPGLTGTQLAARLREAGLDLPVVIVTGYGGPGFELRAQQAGVTRVVRKPYEARMLAEALAVVFLRRPAGSAETYVQD